MKQIIYIDEASRQRLTELAARYEVASFIEGDPSWWMHQVQGADNQEAVAFVAQALSYGSRTQFMPRIGHLLDLAEGDYILNLKVWDIYNNSGTASIAFRVVNSELMVLEEPMCAPNPFTNETYFSFGHNQIGNNMDVQIRVFDMMGRLVAVLNEQVFGTSARTNPIRWDGCSNFGGKLPAGLYVYTITATNDQGEVATITSKLMISK